MTEEADFTLAGYRRLLEKLIERGYRTRSFVDADPGRQHLLLRHDIDFLPEATVEMAEVEQALGLHATYFFLVRTPFYRCDSAETRDVFHRLLQAGHAIGLHFDGGHATDPTTLESAVATDCERLEALTGSAVEVVSFHRPTPALRAFDEPIAGRSHAYQPRFFKEMGYCSDSRGRWRFGHPLDHSAVSNGRALQLLIHPIWWANDDAGNRERALERLVERHGEQIRVAIAQSITGYDPTTGRIVGP